MRRHGRSGAHRAPAARAAIAAALVVLAAGVLVGVGSAQEAPAAVPLLPAVPGPVAPGPTSASAAPAQAPEPTGSRPEPVRVAEPTAVAAPRSLPVRSEPAPAAAPAAAAAAPAAAASAPPAAAAAPLAAAAAPPTLVRGTPCTASARACVDIVGRNAWLFDAGAVVRGPVKIMTGDRDDPTPRGTFRVQWKAEQYTSREYLTQMPYSVFFADGGIAFHEGRQDTPSAGCVKLLHDDAVAWFNFLQVDDEVQIH
jgi:lipoprotein-anchoring transpeptidase ErfK/SrfK